VARGNGRDTGAAETDRANFFIPVTAEGWSLTGCRSYARDQDSILITRYGYYINNTTYAGSIDGSTDEGSITPYFIADGTKIIAHGGVQTSIPHPPLNMNGPLTMEGNLLQTVGAIRFDSWQTISSVSSGAITVPSSGLLSLDFASPTSITDFTYSSTGLPFLILRNITVNDVTFVHNSAKLRLANASNIVLGVNEAIMFVHVTGSVWQQIGGSY
jgi:hypothetical protein